MKTSDEKKEYRRLCKDLQRKTRDSKIKFERKLAYRAKKNHKLVHCYVRDKLKVKLQIRMLKRVDRTLTTKDK
jgi:hypothetical protein